MSPGVPQEMRELETQLAEQLDHIQASADRFDSGVQSEAKRLALAIRILVHDRRQSRSLLGQLGREGVQFFDSAVPYDPSNLADHWGLLVTSAVGPPFVAPLDLERPGVGRWVDFDSWWNEVVFRDEDKREMTRAALVLAVADQDGGAHVDPFLHEAYAAISRQNSLGWFTVYPDGRREPADPPHLQAVRQVAHEMLKTLVPGYEKRPSRPPGTVFWGLQLRESTPEEIEEYERRKSAGPVPTSGQSRSSAVAGRSAALVPEVGRNDPCPCGSGKKYKKCHGSPKGP